MKRLVSHSLIVAALFWAFTGDAAYAQTTQTFTSGPGWTVTNSVGSPAGTSVNVCLQVTTPPNCPAGSVIWGQAGPGWEQDLSPILGATWIWASGFTGANIGNLDRFTFTKTFTLPAAPTAGTVYMTADDLVEIRVNGVLVASYGSVAPGGTSAAYAPLTVVNILPQLRVGANTISFTAQNGPGSYVGNPNATYAENPGGVVFGGSLTSGVATTVQPPTNLYTAVLAGDVVTLRWTAPALGPAPTGYILKGGVAPGQVLGAIATGSTAPIFRFSAPQGAFLVRVHALNGAAESAASNEIPLVVGTARAPSAPAEILGVTEASTFTLSWRPTLEGGPATSYLLDVSGGATATLPVNTTASSLTFPSVPAGEYTLRLRAVNASGASPASDPVVVSLPKGFCPAAPYAPRGLTALVSAGQVTLLWEAPAYGRAVTSYNVRVAGAFTGSFPSASRVLSSGAPPGTYTVFVSAVNACGVGPETGPYTFTVP